MTRNRALLLCVVVSLVTGAAGLLLGWLLPLRDVGDSVHHYSLRDDGAESDLPPTRPDAVAVPPVVQSPVAPTVPLEPLIKSSPPEPVKKREPSSSSPRDQLKSAPPPEMRRQGMDDDFSRAERSKESASSGRDNVPERLLRDYYARDAERPKAKSGKPSPTKPRVPAPAKPPAPEATVQKPPPPPPSTASPTPSAAPVPPAPLVPVNGVNQVTIFYGTSRKWANDTFGPEVDIDPETNTVALHMGTCLITVPVNRKPGTLSQPHGWLDTYWLDVDPDQKEFTLKYINGLPPDRFDKRLAEEVTKRGADILLFVHGYNNSFRSAADRTAQLYVDLGFKGVAAMYSWPSAEDVSTYFHDSEAVDIAVPSFMEYVSRLSDGGKRRICLIVHSMGNRLVTRAAMAQAQREAKDPRDLQVYSHYVMAAPDVNVELFRTSFVGPLKKVARSITILASSGDMALETSLQVHQFHRLGQGGARIVTLPGIQTIDASNIDPGMDGHGYWGNSPPVLDCLRKILVSNEPLTAPPLHQYQHEGVNYYSIARRFPPTLVEIWRMRLLLICAAAILYVVAIWLLVRMQIRVSFRRARLEGASVVEREMHRHLAIAWYACLVVAAVSVWIIMRLVRQNYLSARMPRSWLTGVDMATVLVLATGLGVLLALHSYHVMFHKVLPWFSRKPVATGTKP